VQTFKVILLSCSVATLLTWD